MDFRTTDSDKWRPTDGWKNEALLTSEINRMDDIPVWWVRMNFRPSYTCQLYARWQKRCQTTILYHVKNTVSSASRTLCQGGWASEPAQVILTIIQGEMASSNPRRYVWNNTDCLYDVCTTRLVEPSVNNGKVIGVLSQKTQGLLNVNVDWRGPSWGILC